MIRRSILWQKEQPFGAEYAELTLDGSQLTARGTAVGHSPPYVLNFELQTREDFVTSRLSVTTKGAGWSRTLELVRSGTGSWSIEAHSVGNLDLPGPGGDAGTLDGSLDCDLGLSPLTNSMPVLRHNLHKGGGPVDFLMAWVSVPRLSVHPSEQRYIFLGTDNGRHTFRYEGKHRNFVGDLTFDNEGLVLRYPDLATMVDKSS